MNRSKLIQTSIAFYIRQQWFESSRDKGFHMLEKCYTINSSESFKDYSLEMFSQACQLVFT